MKLTSYKASLQYSDNHCEGDDTITDVTFIGEGVFDPVNVCGLEFMLKTVHLRHHIRIGGANGRRA
jgi:hypothetical protein